MMKKIVIQIVVLILMIGGLVGCGNTSDEDKAKNLIENILNAPNEEISKLMDSDTDMEDYSTKMKTAIKDLCGDDVSEKILEDEGSTLFQNILLFQTSAVISGVTYEVSDVTVTVTEGTNYIYKATVNRSSSKESITITGNIQFDDNHHINDLTIVEPV
jgi:hypothetical protein